MTERPLPPAPALTPDDDDDEAPLPWSREGDELLLLDELEGVDEAPDDDHIDELI